MKYFIIVVTLLTLSGCGAVQPPKVVTNEVIVPVPCKVTPPVKPVMPLTDSGDTKDTIFVKTKKALAELEIRKAYEVQLEAAVRSCQ